MSKARLWIQEMIEHQEWGRTPNKWEAINEIARLIDGSTDKDKKISILERENKALAEEGELKCNEIEKLKSEVDKALDLLDCYNKAFVNICDQHPRIEKDEWRKKVKDE